MRTKEQMVIVTKEHLYVPTAPVESKLATVYAYFTLEEWKTIAHSVQSNESLNKDERYALLCKLPSAAFDGM